MLKTTLFAVAAILIVAAPALAEPVFTGGANDTTFYVNDDLTVWQETNNVEGLQTEPTEDGNGRTIPADEQIV